VTKISLPGTVKSIGDRAFTSCSVLKEIILPKSMFILGSEFFKDYDKLKKITAFRTDHDTATDSGRKNSV